MTTPLTILLADADPRNGRMMAAHLRDMGHTVFLTDSGTEAMRYFDATPQLDLIITDILLRDVDGYRIADMAKFQRPHLNVIYTAQEAETSLDYLGVAHGPVILKPYPLNQILAGIAGLNPVTPQPVTRRPITREVPEHAALLLLNLLLGADLDAELMAA